MKRAVKSFHDDSCYRLLRRLAAVSAVPTRPIRTSRQPAWRLNALQSNAAERTMHASLHVAEGAIVVTALDKELKRQVTVDGLDYTVALDPEGIRVTGKGKRKPQIQLRWHDLLNGDAALAVALNASLTDRQWKATEGIPAKSKR